MSYRNSFKLKDENGNYIPMEEEIKGRGGEVYDYSFEVSIGFDKTTGKITGHREYGVFKILKRLDKSSPIIAQKLAEGIKLAEMEFTMFEHDTTDGVEKIKYQYILEDLSIVSQKSKNFDVNVGERRSMPPLEEIQFVAEKITQLHKDGQIEFTDEYRAKTAAAA